MQGFDRAIIDAAGHEREVELTTWGRKTGKPSRVIIWIATDGQRLFIRSGGGLGRDWPQNLMARERGSLHIAGRDIAIRPRHLTDREEARAVSALISEKYHSSAPRSTGDEPLTPGESASFELLPGT